jgi:hypothetical protein
MAKGSEWERECSKILSLWATEGARDDVVWRTAGSGSRWATRRKRGSDTYNQAGDLCATDPCAQFLFDFLLVECKRGYAKGKPSESINVLYWLDRPSNTKPPLLAQWWEKADEERLRAGRSRAVLLFRRTGKRACIVLERDLMGDLEDYIGQYKHHVIALYMAEGPTLLICDLEKWLEWCQPEAIKRMQETY